MPTIPESIQEKLAAPYDLSKEQIEFYRKNQFIKLKAVLDTYTLEFFNEVISKQVDLMN